MTQIELSHVKENTGVVAQFFLGSILSGALTTKVDT